MTQNYNTTQGCDAAVRYIGQPQNRPKLISRSVAAFFAALALVLCMGSAAYAADNSPKHFDINAKPLADALMEFGVQSGRTVVAPTTLTAGKMAAAVRGDLAPTDALGRLLKGSGLTFAGAADGTIAIQAIPSNGPAQASAKEPGLDEDSTTTPGELGEIVVTASRVKRTGFTAPTPTTVLDAEEVQRRAPNNVSEVLNELPTFRATNSPNTTSLGLTNSGQTYLDLRGLGSQRTLVLVNGRRVTPSSTAGQVDVNVIPSSLVESIEIVTGGASASWGSDAMAGVANIILKKKMQGIEASAQYGTSDRGDGPNYTFSGAAGTSFLDDRGQFTIGSEYSKDEGIDYDGILKRQDWIKNRGSVTNALWATNGLPATIYAENVQFSNQAPGGLITGPNNAAFNGSGLRGTIFNADGTTSRLQYGQVFGTSMIGGGQPGNNFTVWQPYRAPVERWNVLARLDYELSEGLNFNVEASDAHSTTDFLALPPKDGGSTAATVPAGTPAGVLIARIDNPFLPQSVRTTMLNAGLNAVYHRPGWL